MAEIFLSYASEDRDRVAPLVEAFESGGMSVWWDRHIETGSSFSRVIESELDGAQAVVVVWSAASVDSDWVRAEAEEGRRRGCLVPVRIDDVSPPLAFRQTQTADLIGWPSRSADFAAVLARLRVLTGQPGPVAASAPFSTAPRSTRGGWAAGAAVLLLAVVIGWWFVSPTDEAPSSDPATGGQERVKLAVLPFVNLAADPNQQVFVDGLTEEMIFVLGSLRPDRLGVIARTSAMYFRDRDLGIAEIGEQLDVHYLLEGSVRRQQEQLRINAALIRVNDQTRVWSDSFDGHTDDLLALQRDLASRVGDALAIRLLDGTAPTGRNYRPSTEANDAYFLGRSASHKGTGAGWKLAIGHYREAVRLDPEFALAYANLADAYANDAVWTGDRSSYQAARNAAERALSLNPDLAEAHAALALVQLFFEWDWPAAERAFARSIALNPSNGQLLHHYGHYLDFRGRLNESLAAFDRAQELDPISAFHHNCEAMTHIHAGDQASAERQLQRAKALDDELPMYWYTLGMWHDAEGRLEEAIAAWQRAVSLSRVRFNVSALGYGYARAGRRQEAMQILETLAIEWPHGSGAAMERAKIYAGLGEFDRSFALLEEAVASRDPWIIGVRVDVGLPSLATDARYEALLQRLYRSSN